MELKLNKANVSDKETSFLDWNIKIIGSFIHTSVYDKRVDFGFPIVNVPWLSGDVPRLQPYGIYILQIVRFAGCCTRVLKSSNHFLTIEKGLQISQASNTFGKFFRPYCELLSKFSAKSFQEYISFVQTKEGVRRSEFHLVRLENSETPSTSSVGPSAHRASRRL